MGKISDEALVQAFVAAFGRERPLGDLWELSMMDLLVEASDIMVARGYAPVALSEFPKEVCRYFKSLRDEAVSQTEMVAALVDLEQELREEIDEKLCGGCYG